MSYFFTSKENTASCFSRPRCVEAEGLRSSVGYVPVATAVSARVSNSLTSVLPEILDSGRLRQINSGQAESGQADSGKLRQINSGQAESSQANATQAATVGRGRDIRARPRLSRHRAIPLPRVLDRPSRCISSPRPCAQSSLISAKARLRQTQANELSSDVDIPPHGRI